MGLIQALVSDYERLYPESRERMVRAEQVEADARRISFYENDKTTPSVETLIQTARMFDFSLDFLVLEAPRRVVQASDQALRHLGLFSDGGRPSFRKRTCSGAGRL